MACEARQEGDEMACACGLRWDVHDPNPPTCRRQRHAVPVTPAKRELLQGARKEYAANMIFTTGDKNAIADTANPNIRFVLTAQIPLVLPADVASRMFATFLSREQASGDPIDAMRAAYRVFLDSLP